MCTQCITTSKIGQVLQTVKNDMPPCDVLRPALYRIAGQVAQRLGRWPTHVSAWARPHKGRTATGKASPLDRLIELGCAIEAVAPGRFRPVVAYLARRFGLGIYTLPAETSERRISDEIAVFTKEFAAALSVVSDAWRDSRLTRKEVRECLRQLQTLEQETATLEALLTHKVVCDGAV